MKTKTWAAMTLAMIATPVILVMLARNDLGEDRFYGTLQTAAIVFVVIALGVAIGAYTLVLIRVRGEATAKVEAARRTTAERHIYHEKTHTIDGRGTFNVAGGDPLAYPDLVRQLLNTQHPGQQQPQLQAGIPAQLPQLQAGYSAQTAQVPARRLEDVVPMTLDEPGWSPYAGMASEW